MIKAIVGTCFLIFITLVVCILLGIELLLIEATFWGWLFLAPSILFILICIGVLIYEEIAYRKIKNTNNG